MRRATTCALAALITFTAFPAGRAAAAAESTSSPGCTRSTVAASPDPGVTTIDFDGAPRQYRFVTPEITDPAEPLPLILNFHGYTSNAAAQAAYSQLEAKAPARGYVVVTPQGTGSPAFWNILPNLPKPDDVAFASALIDTAGEQLCIDPDRVYSTGMSNGGGMSALLGCDLTKRVAAIAPVAGVNLVQPCPRGNPVSVIAFHGEADAVVKYGGGPPSVGATNLDLPPVEDAVAGFAQRDGCRKRPVTRSIGDEVERYTYRSCEAGSDVVLYSVTNGGHTWPGSIDVPRLGHVTQDINAADLMLDFFDEHPGTASATK